MTSVPVDPISIWKKPNWGFAIVANDVNGETLDTAHQGPHPQGIGHTPVPCALN
jgi:hypothetical protein